MFRADAHPSQPPTTKLPHASPIPRYPSLAMYNDVVDLRDFYATSLG